MNEWQIQLEEDLNRSVDQDLGTVVAVCDGMGRHDDGSLLEVCELRYHVADDSWNPQIVTASLMVDPLLLTTVQESGVADQLLETLKQIHDGGDFAIYSVAIRPKRVPPSWRQGRIEARLSDVEPNNQASYRTLPENHPRKDRLNFHTDGELRMYEALVRAQQRRPPEATIGILPGAGFRAAERTFWPDFVVTHRGRAPAKSRFVSFVR